MAPLLRLGSGERLLASVSSVVVVAAGDPDLCEEERGSSSCKTTSEADLYDRERVLEGTGSGSCFPGSAMF